MRFQVEKLIDIGIKCSSLWAVEKRLIYMVAEMIILMPLAVAQIQCSVSMLEELIL